MSKFVTIMLWIISLIAAMGTVGVYGEGEYAASAGFAALMGVAGMGGIALISIYMREFE